MDSRPEALRTGRGGAGKRPAKRFKVPHPEEQIHTAQQEILALVGAEHKEQVESLLYAIDRHHETRMITWDDSHWRCVARWLIRHGRAKLWRRMYRDLGFDNGLFRSGWADPEEPWRIAYGKHWFSGHPELKRLAGADRDRLQRRALVGKDGPVLPREAK